MDEQCMPSYPNKPQQGSIFASQHQTAKFGIPIVYHQISFPTTKSVPTASTASTNGRVSKIGPYPESNLRPAKLGVLARPLGPSPTGPHITLPLPLRLRQSLPLPLHVHNAIVLARSIVVAFPTWNINEGEARMMDWGEEGRNRQ